MIGDFVPDYHSVAWAQLNTATSQIGPWNPGWIIPDPSGSWGDLRIIWKVDMKYYGSQDITMADNTMLLFVQYGGTAPSQQYPTFQTYLVHITDKLEVQPYDGNEQQILHSSLGTPLTLYFGSEIKGTGNGGMSNSFPHPPSLDRLSEAMMSLTIYSSLPSTYAQSFPLFAISATGTSFRTFPQLDGSQTGSTTGSSISINLPTARNNEVLYLSIVTQNGVTVNSVTTAGLTWTRRSNVQMASSTGNLETWYAVSPTSGTKSVAISFTGSGHKVAMGFGVSGANIVSPFSGGSTTASGQGTSASLSKSTNTVNTILIGTLGLNNDNSLTVGPGFTLIGTGFCRQKPDCNIKRVPNTCDSSIEYNRKLFVDRDFAELGINSRCHTRLKLCDFHYEGNKAGNLLLSKLSLSFEEVYRETLGRIAYEFHYFRDI